MKPSEIKTIKAKKTRLLLPGFMGITWMGTVYCRKEKDIETINRSEEIDSNFKSHETIHVRQAQTMKDSWTRFYLNYAFNYLKNLPLLITGTRNPYRLIPTEIEAYLNEGNWKYTEQPTMQWKKLQKLSLKQKFQIAHLYNEFKRRKTYTNILKEYFKENQLP